MLSKISPLRKNHLREKFKDPKYLHKLDAAEKKNIAEYGYPYVKNLYSPHITLTALSEQEKRATTDSIQNIKLKDFTCSKIGIFYMGDHGTCTKLIKEFSLSN